MSTLVLKMYVPFIACAGLLAAADLPPGWLQLGVAGASLFVLLLHMRMTFKQNREMMTAHQETIVGVTEKFDGLIRDVLDLKKD